MPFQYSRISWNMITLLANSVFNKILNFQWWILASIHTLFLFNVPLVKLFGPSYSFLQWNLCTLEIDLLESNINFCIITCILTSLVKGMPKLNTLPRCIKCRKCTFHHRKNCFCEDGQSPTFILVIWDYLIQQIVRRQKCFHLC